MRIRHCAALRWLAPMFALALCAALPRPAQAQYVYRINSGGPANGPLAADNYFSNYNSGGFAYAGAPINTSAVSNPLPVSAYQDLRAAYNGSPIVYTFPNLVANRRYRVRLHFYDFFATPTRTESVSINGRTYLQSFDIGGTDKVSVQDFTAPADANGKLTVTISGVNDSPFLNAIEVLNVKVYYVAKNGSDNWSGGLASPNSGATDGPFATLARARDAIRTLKTNNQFDRPVTVYVRSGSYYLPQTLTFTANDSGTGVNRIVYENYPSEVPIISGGRQFTGWVDEAINGKTAWKVTLPEVANGSYYFRDLWVNGQRRIRSRTPDVGFFQIQGGEPNKPAGHNDRKFVYRGSDLDGLSNVGWADAVLLAQWTSSHLPLTSIDKTTKTLSFGKETAFGLGNGERYWIENTLSGLNLPGEWYLRKSTGELYYLPKPGETKSNTTIVAPVLENIVRFDGDPGAGVLITDLVFRGLTFAHAQWWFPADFQAGGPGLGDTQNTWTLGIFENAGFNTAYARVGLPGAILANGLHYSTFDRNTIKNVAGYGIELRDGSKNDRIDGNRITDVGGGIKLGRRDFNGQGPLETTDIVVSDNTISDGGYRFTGAVGIFWGFSRNNLIVHNEVFDFNYSGIGAGAFDYNDIAGTGGNIIAHNDVHHVGQNRNFSPNAPVLGDLGGIYLYDTQPGTVIDNNRVHHVTGEYGGHGIYLDERSGSVTVKNNLAYRNQSDDFFSWLQSGRNTVIENNIFAFAQEGVLRIGYFDTGFVTVRKNIVYYAGGGQSDPTLYANMYWDGYIQNGVNVGIASDYNLYYNVNQNGYFARNAAGGGTFNVQDTGFQSAYQVDSHSAFQDPLFVDPNNDDYHLRPDSPLFQSGTPANSIGFDTNAIKYDFGPRYAPPTIGGLSVSSALTGSPGFPLIITGAGFPADAIVKFGADILTPTAVSKTALTVSIPSSLLSVSANKAVAVSGPATGDATPSALFTIGVPTFQFPTATATRSGGDLTVTVSLANSSPIDAPSVRLTSATLAAGGKTYPASGLPFSVGRVSGNGAATITLRFAGANAAPARVGAIRLAGAFATRGTFSASGAATIP